MSVSADLRRDTKASHPHPARLPAPAAGTVGVP
jgi:hypothetical protein